MAMITTKVASALSATFAIMFFLSIFMPSSRPWASPTTCSSVHSFGNFHTNKKASPMFLLADPPCRLTSICTICAIEFTNSITPSCSTSVASVNCRISQNPKMAHIFFPGTMGFSSPPFLRFSAMISAPASPKPTAMREQILEKAFSRILVSNCWSSPSSLNSCFWSGFSAMSRTFLIMRSMGIITRLFASLLKSIAPRPRIIQMNMVRQMLSQA
mmetsp:Transcript_3670/g.4919  ORF Transcript_3670/g.4919 Transcript_3670/m.4919 type:complete len:215 (-) Transcript_3670:1943-2587(-)